MGLTADTLEVVTVHNALETLTFGSTDNINECHILFEDVGNGESVAKLEFALEICLKLHEFAHRSDPCLCKMALKSLAGVLFCGFVIGKLHCGIAVCFDSADLRFFPSAPKTEVIPIFFPINPGIGLLINCL